jgi:hypothetical protein
MESPKKSGGTFSGSIYGFPIVSNTLIKNQRMIYASIIELKIAEPTKNCSPDGLQFVQGSGARIRPRCANDPDPKNYQIRIAP